MLVRSASADILLSAVIIMVLLAACNGLFFHSLKRTAVYAGFGIYLAAVLELSGFPAITSLTVSFTLNVTPFLGAASDFAGVFLNVPLFVPFGFFLPVLWQDFRKLPVTALAGFVTSLGIEALQIFTLRTSDITDLITAVAGTLLGYALARVATGRFARLAASGARPADLAVIAAVAVLTVFALQPAAASLLRG